MKNNITIIGAGLTGPLLCSILSNYSLNIDMFERSDDIRKSEQFSGRSINLALSKRGIKSLRSAGVYTKELESSLIPMYGRAVHLSTGKIDFQKYGNKNSHYINSVSREVINKSLLNTCQTRSNVKIKFNMKCTGADLINNEIIVNNKTVRINNPVIGADGYRSVIAKNISNIEGTKPEYVSIQHSYKELTIGPRNNEYQLDPNALHIWPRRDMMMIALPNLDRSFTCTLFMRSSGKNSFTDIDTKEKLYNFFEKYFSDSIGLISDLDGDFFNNPTGNLIGLRVPKWNYLDKALVIGDAAHATVPFYGQGMNAAFEDCYIFSKIVDKYSDMDWKQIFYEFYEKRKTNADSLLDLSLDNYRVMRSDVLDQSHAKKQQLAFLLNNDFPEYFIPLYTMVSFTTIPYKTALDRGKVQDKILCELVNNLDKVENYNKSLANKLITKYLTKIDEN